MAAVSVAAITATATAVPAAAAAAPVLSPAVVAAAKYPALAQLRSAVDVRYAIDHADQYLKPIGECRTLQWAWQGKLNSHDSDVEDEYEEDSRRDYDPRYNRFRLWRVLAEQQQNESISCAHGRLFTGELTAATLTIAPPTFGHIGVTSSSSSGCMDDHRMDAISLAAFGIEDSDDFNQLLSLRDAAISAVYGDIATLTTKQDPKIRKGRDLAFVPRIGDIVRAIPSVNHSLLRALERHWSKSGMLPRVRVVPYKINFYGAGDHFARHTDTPEMGLIGTMLLGLHDSSDDKASTMIHFKQTGGRHVHVSRRKPKQQQHSSSDNNSHDDDDDQPATVKWRATLGAWCAFFTNVPHEVLPVTSGQRITLSFKVFSSTDDDDGGEPSQKHEKKKSLKQKRPSSSSSSSTKNNNNDNDSKDNSRTAKRKRTNVFKDDKISAAVAATQVVDRSHPPTLHVVTLSSSSAAVVTASSSSSVPAADKPKKSIKKVTKHTAAAAAATASAPHLDITSSSSSSSKRVVGARVKPLAERAAQRQKAKDGNDDEAIAAVNAQRRERMAAKKLERDQRLAAARAHKRGIVDAYTATGIVAATYDLAEWSRPLHHVRHQLIYDVATDATSSGGDVVADKERYQRLAEQKEKDDTAFEHLVTTLTATVMREREAAADASFIAATEAYNIATAALAATQAAAATEAVDAAANGIVIAAKKQPRPKRLQVPRRVKVYERVVEHEVRREQTLKRLSMEPGQHLQFGLVLKNFYSLFPGEMKGGDAKLLEWLRSFLQPTNGGIQWATNIEVLPVRIQFNGERSSWEYSNGWEPQCSTSVYALGQPELGHILSPQTKTKSSVSHRKGHRILRDEDKPQLPIPFYSVHNAQIGERWSHEHEAAENGSNGNVAPETEDSLYVACALIITLRSLRDVITELLPHHHVLPSPLLDIITSYAPSLEKWLS